MITDDGCWADYRISPSLTAGQSCLFLDRDGVLIEDTGYPHDPATIMLIPETLDLVRLAKTRGLVVGLVTNQSGVGRGYFGWDAFAAVQSAIDAALIARHTALDFILACPHHPEASIARYRYEQHPWRKPSPGMLTAALDTFQLIASTSAMIGDQHSDMVAAQKAGIAHRGLLVKTRNAAPQGDWEEVKRDSVSTWLSEIFPTR